MRVTLATLLIIFAAKFIAAGNSVRCGNSSERIFAVVVGVSNYRDAEMPDLKYARRDAEAFTAFLQSKSGGEIPKENIRLLTDAHATNAGINAAFDWLIENSFRADRLIFYFAGYGQTNLNHRQEPRYFFPSDAPVTPLNAGAFETEQIAGLVDLITYTKQSDFLIFANLYPLPLFDVKTDLDSLKGKSEKPFFKNSFVYKTEKKQLNRPDEKFKKVELTNNHLLLDGLLGYADRNEDEEITFRELRRFLNKSKSNVSRQPGLLFCASLQQKTVVAKVDLKTFEKLKEQTGDLFPSIIEMETGAKEERILKKVSGDVKLLYRDFVIAVKLGNLLFPKGKSADDFYKKLIQKEELKKLYGGMRRKLAVALQDEVQQALNAYLKLDNRELDRRDKDLETYLKYTSYLGRSIELFGERSFMSAVMTAKYEYFNGLVLRMESVRNNRPDLLDLAIKSQLKALEIVPEAAFVYNELGVICSLKEERESAVEYFRKAAENSPSWGIPYSNMSIVMAKSEDYENAIKNGIKAFQCSPKNVYVSNTLAGIYLRAGDLRSSERMYGIVLKKEPKNAHAHYGLACIYALSGKTESALLSLEKALKFGFDDFEHLVGDPDLDSLKSREDFSVLLKRYSDK